MSRSLLSSKMSDQRSQADQDQMKKLREQISRLKKQSKENKLKEQKTKQQKKRHQEELRKQKQQRKKSRERHQKKESQRIEQQENLRIGIQKAWRHSKVGDNQEALKQLSNIPDEGLTAPIKSWLKSIWSWIKKNPKKTLLIVALIIVVCCGIGLYQLGFLDAFLSSVQSFAISSWASIQQLFFKGWGCMRCQYLGISESSGITILQVGPAVGTLLKVGPSVSLAIDSRSESLSKIGTFINS